jgi:phosphate transport system protein
MPKQLERDLERVHQDLLALAACVETAILSATEALRERDAALARKVVNGDDDIDREENRVENECLKVLALHQPVAGDLRRICCAMMINVDLERMGDLAVNIAERAVVLAGHPVVPVPDELQAMTDLTSVMVRQALEAFLREDARLARSVCRLDDEVDRLNDRCIEEVVDAMKKDLALVEPGLSLFSAVRHLERIADHATSIAEDVVYLVEGEIVRHRPEAIHDGM